MAFDFSSDSSLRFSMKWILNQSFRKSVVYTTKPSMNESAFDSLEEKNSDRIKDSRKDRNPFSSKHTNKLSSKLSLNQSVNEESPCTMK